MKKLISSILALTLVAGMSVTAFAAGPGEIVGFTTDNPITEDTGYNKSANTTYTTIISYSDLNAQKVDAADAALTSASANDVNAQYGATKTIEAVVTNNENVVGTPTITSTSSGLKVTYKTETASNIAASTDKDNFSLVLTFTATGDNVAGTLAGTAASDTKAVIIGGSFLSHNLNGWKIDDVVNGGNGIQLGDSAGWEVSGMAKGSTSNLSNLDIRPDAEIKVFLSSDDFDWIDGDDNVAQQSGFIVSTSQLRTGKITVKKSVSKGSNVIEDISIDSDKTHGAYILVEFVEYFVSVNEQDVDFTVYLAKKNAKRSGTDLDISGTMENEVEEVSEDDDYVTCEEGIVVDPQDYVRGIQVYLGNGVTVTTNLFKDKKYYGVALNTFDSTDSVILDEYPSIDNVLTLKTVNLKASGNIVSFNMEGDYYVYGADGTYLGLSTEKVVFSDKYYFSTERINIVDGDLEDPDPIDDLGDIDLGDDLGNEELGGDDANNANDNPGTGVNGFVGVAVAAGLISLAAVAVTARKKK